MNGGEEGLSTAFGSFVIELATQESEGLARGVNLEMIELMLGMTGCTDVHLAALALEF